MGSGSMDTTQMRMKNYMSKVDVAFAKLAGIQKAVSTVLDDEHARKGRLPIQNFKVDEVGRYFSSAQNQLCLLRKELPDLYEDFVYLPAIPNTEMSKVSADVEAEWRYSRTQLLQLAREIDHIFEIRANSELATPTPETKLMRCVFISHGRAPDWREVQAYIEKDIGLATLELAQEANQGRTILGKLCEVSEQCDSAVIVMTGDDLDAEGQARARENVIHEIGFFQGKYGLSRICLLYEKGISIPSNIQGLVYTPFPKGMVSASFGALVRELDSMYK